MSACSSSPILPKVAEAGPVIGSPDEASAVDLLSALAAVPDPRDPRGRRYRLVTVLGLAVCAVSAGARSYTAIAEWARDLTRTVSELLGLSARGTPSEAAIRRLLQRLDAEQLDRAVSGWLTARVTAAAPVPEPEQGSVSTHEPAARVIAIDGKTARGSRTRPSHDNDGQAADGRAVHLLGALDHATGVVFGQTTVKGKSNEITAFAPLLDRIDITGAIITADAMHTQREHANYLRKRGAHYILTAKANQPGLLAQLTELPWARIPIADTATNKGHGRLESRTLQLTELDPTDPAIKFPHAHLAIRLTRRRKRPTDTTWDTEIVYAITDLDWTTTRPHRINHALRGHWGIENRVHWVRDVTFAEDHSQIRTGAGPAVMATLRNLALSIHRLHGATNIAKAIRHTAGHPNRVLPLLT